MKKMVLMGLSLAVLSSTHLSATWMDWTGKNKAKKLAFSNQVIEEVLSPEQMKNKVRNEELIQGSGDYISINEILSGSEGSYDEELCYFLKEEFYEITHEKLMSGCRSLAFKRMKEAFKKRKIVGGDFHYEIISEKPQDIIYVAEGESRDPESDFGIIFIMREAQIKKWRFVVGYEAVASKVTPKIKAQWIEKLKNIPSINSWIAKNR